MKKTITAGLTMLLMSVPALASIITVEFDVTINQRYAYNGEPAYTFVPLTHQYSSLTFDNTVTGVSRFWDTSALPINTFVRTDFGSGGTTAIVSPVSALVDANPLPTTPIVSGSVRSSLAYQFPPHSDTAQFSHFLTASVTTRSSISYPDPMNYAGASWTRNVSLGSHIGYHGPIVRETFDDHSFVTGDLMTYLVDMQRSGAAFSFSDRYYFEERPSLFLDQLEFRGTAVITRIIDSDAVAVPEPASIALFAFGMAGLLLTRRKKPN